MIYLNDDQLDNSRSYRKSFQEATEEASKHESNLVFHAHRELLLLGEDPETIDGYLKIIQAFADMGHSGGSASIAIPTIARLLRFGNLRPLTDDPDEWYQHSEEVWGEVEGVWQNRRNSEAFSNDNGQTYYLLSEVQNGSSKNDKKLMHTSVVTREGEHGQKMKASREKE